MQTVLRLLNFSLGLSLLIGCQQLQRKSNLDYSLKADWIKNLNQNENNFFRPSNRFFTVLYKNKVIQGNSLDGLSALDAKTGNLIWNKQIVNGVEAAGALDIKFDSKQSALFFGGKDGFFYAINADNGNLIWQFAVKSEVLAEPVFDESNVYFISGSNVLYALDKFSGQQKWIYARSETQPISLRGGGKPALTREAVLVGMADGAIVSVDKSSGALRWEKQLNAGRKIRDIDSNILIDNEFMYVMSYGGVVASLRHLTGDLVWKIDKLGGPGYMISDKTYLYFSSSDEQLIQLNKETQEKKVIFNFKNAVGNTPIFVDQNKIAVSDSSGKIYLVNIDKVENLAMYEAGTSIFTNLSYNHSESALYFVTSESNLHKVKIIK